MFHNYTERAPTSHHEPPPDHHHYKVVTSPIAASPDQFANHSYPFHLLICRPSPTSTFTTTCLTNVQQLIDKCNCD
ncbi:hypothetical protein HanXRQr2_Chr13g0597171 [Helianthus annuus]|uniref:Uncharacterized protein n=1 Tax=Helianthus annuus TaxID=4232 RepID=A0A251SUJ9_HELAN|nr:hypothetical protein HanXRQr2_Chr13g0597171 [Helianthus annuus]KAJ0477561.1 hypothetical protein HanHA300_Chr13g0489951 [Helianthus annuus]KAJ0482063.1 hypothetical protein HanIR_Chr13g0649711 [Helianthus annuus]KAJ0498391.1 hypothetical protein HanHA89_Chr13g0522071 [Helianthus annuus]KAJ0664402.1 hypothetical protein HanLR1_Chr13g0492011 [Helianthus annuus]